MDVKHILDLLDKKSVVNQFSSRFDYLLARGLNLNIIVISIITVFTDQIELQWSALGLLNCHDRPMPSLPQLQRPAGAAKEPAAGQYMIAAIQKKKKNCDK